MKYEEMNYDDLTVIEVPVSIKGVKYTLREADGGAATRYRNACLACTKLGPEGKPCSVEGMANVEPLLVSLCLFDENNRPVPEHIVRAWPARVQKALFNRAKEISGLDENEDEEESKNEPSDTMDGSS